MKAKPVRLVHGEGYIGCSVEEATHVTLRFPGPSGLRTLPVILHGSRDDTGCWTWNGSTDAPTLRPSIRTRAHGFLCHSWVNDGHAVFLEDCTHDLRGQTHEMLEVPDAA